jgi:hypothetical protein
MELHIHRSDCWSGHPRLPECFVRTDLDPVSDARYASFASELRRHGTLTDTSGDSQRAGHHCHPIPTSVCCAVCRAVPILRTISTCQGSGFISYYCISIQQDEGKTSRHRLWHSENSNSVYVQDNNYGLYTIRSDESPSTPTPKEGFLAIGRPCSLFGDCHDFRDSYLACRTVEPPQSCPMMREVGA